jgi:hypothetical protein
MDLHSSILAAAMPLLKHFRRAALPPNLPASIPKTTVTKVQNGRLPVCLRHERPHQSLSGRAGGF